MRFMYDEPKRLKNLAKHGYDFADLPEDFFDAAAVLPAKGRRYMAISEFNGKVVTVIFAPLGSEAISLVSMRRASVYERSL